ncbi:tail fiber assembly protein [Trinickia mobilis]|uniref:tail fiber assembly protein n=1 Tax=Trinickia mobilis TaxID=2816356 RepID=UPI001F5C5EED|nr:tail fiber assembly protein [Trinickia mobilis]
MLIHQYDALTGQYISSRLADSDPRNLDCWLVPAFSTVDELPARTPLTWPFYLNGAWKLLPDYRGRMLYRQDNGEAAEILVAGMTPPDAGLTETPRPSAEHVWHDGAWVIDPAVVAQNVRASAMAEFEKRLAHARDMNAGKADALAAGLLTPEEAYYFRAWSTYQLDLVRAIQRDGFPETVTWPAEPISFDEAMAPVMAEFNARMAKARTFTDGKAEAYAAGTLSDRKAYEYCVWSDYETALSLALERDPLPAVRWPAEPQPYPLPADSEIADESPAESAPDTSASA